VSGENRLKGNTKEKTLRRLGDPSRKETDGSSIVWDTSGYMRSRRGKGGAPHTKRKISGKGTFSRAHREKKKTEPQGRRWKTPFKTKEKDHSHFLRKPGRVPPLTPKRNKTREEKRKRTLK